MECDELRSFKISLASVSDNLFVPPQMDALVLGDVIYGMILLIIDSRIRLPGKMSLIAMGHGSISELAALFCSRTPTPWQWFIVTKYKIFSCTVLHK